MIVSAKPGVGDGCVELSGTTTNSREQWQRIYEAAGYQNGGWLYRDRVLLTEPTNPVDADAADGERPAVAVHIDGARVGYLPGWLAAQVGTQLPDGTPVAVQLWGKESDGDVRVRALV